MVLLNVVQWLMSALRHFGGYLPRSLLKSIEPASKASVEKSNLDVNKIIPPDLASWKRSIFSDSKDIWGTLRPLFTSHGLSLWSSLATAPYTLLWTDVMPSPSGYLYHSPESRSPSVSQPEWNPFHGAQYAARSDQGNDFIVSVMAVGKSDQKALNHLRIVRQLSATYPDILLSNNHILPLVKEIFYEDVVFGVFPMLQGPTLSSCLRPNLPARSVEDAVFLILQALEAICYIHNKRIAHRDLFLENFLVEWTPLSLAYPTSTRPRVYLIDFETAVQFGDDVPSDAMMLDTNNLPFPEDEYSRQPAPELYLEDDYCPFKLDIWQFGHELNERFTSTTIPEIDNLWPMLVLESPAERPTADEVLTTLRDFVHSVPPQRLHIPFDFEMIR